MAEQGTQRPSWFDMCVIGRDPGRSMTLRTECTGTTICGTICATVIVIP
jgi:hypothetical protein